jgi:hypothetical protein
LEALEPEAADAAAACPPIDGTVVAVARLEALETAEKERPAKAEAKRAAIMELA